jgi:peptidyl-prolyl cis-trans isomerase C
MTATNGNHLAKIARGLALAIAVAASGGLVVAQEAPVAPPAATPAVPPAAAVELAPDPDRVYAIIDGVPITEADLDVAAQDYIEELNQMPPEARLTQLLNVVIDMRLLARAAESAGVDKQEIVVRRLAFNRSRALRNEYLRDKATKVVTKESVQVRFDKEVADFKPGDEFHLHHILVKTEAEAKAVIVEIEKGGDFATLAKAKSIDPGSGARGGDLGFVPAGKTFPEFEKAAFALEVGAMTKQPVESQVGWHVIKLEEKRKEPPPELAAEVERIRNDLIREFVNGEVESLRAAAKIEIVPPPEPPAAVEPPAAAEPPATPAK